MKLLVIDGNSIINRAFYGIRLLSNKKGIFTNAVTGFLNIYLKLIAAYKPDGAAAAFDLKAPTFRHKAYDGYKAGRKGMPDELAMQLPYVKDILRAMGVKVLECEGYEADDILGTLAHACDERGFECVIATGDRDSFQLITDRVCVNLASTKEDILYTPEKIREVYGVSPAEMLEVKALMGDSSDNIPGLKRGVGPKRALKIINEDVNQWIEDEKLQDEYARNMKLISFDCIPKEIEISINTVINNLTYGEPDTKKYFKFIQMSGLAELMNTFTDYVNLLKKVH